MSSAEQLTIDTPEQVALELPLAGVGSRFLAIAIDTLLQTVLGLVVVVVLFNTGPALARALPAGDTWAAILPALGLLVLFGLYWAYFAAFEIAWRGQTPGKRLAGLRVIRDTGRPLDATAAILRNLLRAVDLLPGFYAVGVTCMLLNRQSRRLGDFVAGTIVVHDRTPERLRADWITASGQPGIGGAMAGARITTGELVLIEAYLERRPELDWVVREATAERIAQRIATRTGLSRAPEQTIDDFLEAVARQARDTARF